MTRLNSLKSGKGQRLALFLPDMGGGGAERVALTLMEGFLDHGHSVDLVLAEKAGALLPLVPSEVTVFGLQAPRQRRSVSRLASYLRKRRPFALHAMMWPLPVSAVLARRLAGVATRIVGSEHTTLSTMPSALRHRVVRMITTHSYKAADALIAVSAGVADDMVELLRLDRSIVEVVHNPISLPTCLPTPTSAVQLWPSGSLRLLAVGELKTEKNFPLLLRSLALLRKHTAATLLILGEGHLESALRRQVRELGLEAAVHFQGFDTNVWPYYTAADLFVLSSDFEGYGNVLIEALYAGLRIVSTDCPSGPREILAEGRFGALVPPQDEQALADAILQTVDTPHDPASGRKRAAELSGNIPLCRHLGLMLGY